MPLLERSPWARGARRARNTPLLVRQVDDGTNSSNTIKQIPVYLSVSSQHRGLPCFGALLFRAATTPQYTTFVFLTVLLRQIYCDAQHTLIFVNNEVPGPEPSMQQVRPTVQQCRAQGDRVAASTKQKTTLNTS